MRSSDAREAWPALQSYKWFYRKEKMLHDHVKARKIEPQTRAAQRTDRGDGWKQSPHINVKNL